MHAVYLVRHGESTSNVGAATEDPVNIPLTPRGVAQAAALADAFCLRPQAIVHSPFLRARATAEPLIARHPTAEVAVWPVEEFTYLDVAAWRGTTWRERLPAVEAFWGRADPHHRDSPAVESFADLIDRARRAHAALHTLPPDSVLVSHGLFLCAMVWQLQAPDPLDMKAFRAWQNLHLPGNTAVIRLPLKPSSSRPSRPMLLMPEVTRPA